MRLFNSFRSGAVAATLAFTAMTAPAQAATYVLDLTGTVADATTFMAGGNSVLSLSLSYFDPFFVEVGDEVTVNVALDEFLLTPAAANQIFTLDLNGGFANNDLNNSSTQFDLLDGDLAGQTFFSGCSNCFSAVIGRFPGTAFSVQNLTAIFTIDSISEPIEFTNAALGYQLSAGAGGGGAVPEPSTWAVMILGFGLAGAALRRRTAVRA